MRVSTLQLFFDTSSHPTATPRIPLHVVVLLSSLVAFVMSVGLIALIQIDFPLIQFLRATPLKSLDDIGRIGNQLGHGSTLVILSAIALAIGFIRNQHRLKQVGVQSLVAHGVAGLFVQLIKHSIGRPRPRLAHLDHWQIGPSFQTGLDAFPSGHSAASFAVAAVFARHFPRYAWLMYSSAGLVALSRIVKGSHFPSDACMGALLGFVVGYIVSRPLKSWGTSFIEALAKGLPYFVAGLGGLWIAVQKSTIETLYHVILTGGILVMTVSYGIRVRERLALINSTIVGRTGLTMSTLFLFLGVALCSGSFLVTGLATASGMISWIVSHHQPEETIVQSDNTSSPRILAQEVFLGLGLVLFIGLIHQIRGIIPLI